MNQWYRQIQAAVESIDAAIRTGADEQLTLHGLARAFSYSPSHMTRRFHAMTGMPLRSYLRGRRLAFALLEVRDSNKTLLDIAVRYGFSSHEAFTRAFKAAYGITPGLYRRQPVPVVLRSRINPLDRYLLGQGEIGMLTSNEELKVYFTKVPAHKFLHIKNYESNGYFDFWEKQETIPGQDCDTICGLLDSMKGKLDGDDSVIGQYSGQIMGFPREANGKMPEAYGVRMPADWRGELPAGMLSLDIAEGEYLVFEHGPFDFETQCGGVYEQLEEAIRAFDWSGSGCGPDNSAGRIAYYYNDPARFLKRVLPVKKR